jgi:hypothetical protein
MSLEPPSWLGQAPPFTLVTPTTGSTVATSGNGTTNIFTSVSLPAGTYFVGASYTLTSTTTFENTDTILFFITDTGGSLTLYPQVLLTGITEFGSNPASQSVTVNGILILTAATTISWKITCAFNLATGKTVYLINPFYQRVA